MVARWQSRLLLGVALVLFCPALSSAAGVRALFDLDSPQGGPFPSDRFTVADPTQLTGLRVNLPKPDCGTRPSDCEDLDVVNTLDGFNVQPRLSIPFSGPIDASSVSSETVFLVRLGSVLPGAPGDQIVAINQVVWDVATNTLHVESDELLEQHTRYALIVTGGVRDHAGDPVEPAEDFTRFRQGLNFGQTRDPHLKAYRKALLGALETARAGGVHSGDVVAASVFTTLSGTAILEKLRDRVKTAPPPAPADFGLRPGESRTVFPFGDPLTAIVFRRQVSTAPSFRTSHFFGPGAPGFKPPTSLIAFGKYRSPNYLRADALIPPVSTLTGEPELLDEHEVYFTLHLPLRPPPPGGWPVAIFGHGFESIRLLTVALERELIAEGIALIAINAVGHGGGPLSTITVEQFDAEPVTFSAGGRSVDLNGDGLIGFAEGLVALGPHRLISTRDGNRQTVVDLMQLVRVIQVGMDVDGDGVVDLDPSRIYYFGHSNGGNYGALFLAVEPDVRVGVLNAPGTAIGARLSPHFRPRVAAPLGRRVPSLLNDGADFEENIPLRDHPPVVNTVPGAMDLQEFFDREEWVRQPGNSIAYAPHLRRAPLAGLSPASVIVQFAMGDRLAPNPMTTALLRAGELADRATYLRWDLVLAAGITTRKDPHDFILFSPSTRRQIARFFASEGEVVIDPDGPGPFFETPIVPPLPETLNYFQ